MGWLLLAAAAVAVFVFSKKESLGLRIPDVVLPPATGGVELTVWQQPEGVPPGPAGTWAYGVTDARGEPLHVDAPFASEAAARSAGLLWMSENVSPIPDPIPIPQPQPGQQGGGVVLPYLVITGGGLSGSAVVEGSKVRWTIAGESALAGSVSTANATLLQRFDTKVPDNDDIGISLTRSTGQIVRARVHREPAQVVPWAWEVFIGGASQKRAFWRANTRLAAMRGALSTLQDS